MTLPNGTSDTGIGLRLANTRSVLEEFTTPSEYDNCGLTRTNETTEHWSTPSPRAVSPRMRTYRMLGVPPPGSAAPAQNITQDGTRRLAGGIRQRLVHRPPVLR